MRKILYLIIFTSYLSFGQNKFVGNYTLIQQFTDTLEDPPVEYIYNKSFQIKGDFTYTYIDEENPSTFPKPEKESIEGSWKYHGDTIVFYNKNFNTPKGYKYNYYKNQKFTGIKLIVKDSLLNLLDIESCSLDSTAPNGKGIYMSQPCKMTSSKYCYIKNPQFTEIHFTPKGLCKDFRQCGFDLGLIGIESGTLIELICYSKQIDIEFNGKQYKLEKNVLREISTSCSMPYSWTDKFIKTK